MTQPTRAPRTCQWREQVHVIFLEILGTVESSLRQLAALVRYSGPVRLTHHEADSALSICVLLLFEVGPSNLDRDGEGCLFMTSENHLHIKGFTWNRVFLRPSLASMFPLSRSSALPFSSLAQTCVWRSRQAAAGSRQGRRPRASSSRCLPAHPTCLYKGKRGVQMHAELTGCTGTSQHDWRLLQHVYKRSFWNGPILSGSKIYMQQQLARYAVGAINMEVEVPQRWGGGGGGFMGVEVCLISQYCCMHVLDPELQK